MTNLPNIPFRPFVAVLMAVVFASGCATTSSDRADARRHTDARATPNGQGLVRHAPAERDLQVRVRPDGTCEYMADIFRDPRRLAKRLEKDAYSGKGRNRKLRPITLVARGKVPMSDLVSLRERLIDLGLPSIVIRSSWNSSVTVEAPK